MEIDMATLAGVTGIVGTVAGVVGALFAKGRHDGAVEGKIDALSEKVDYMNDELARRITVLENRVQYDGYYEGPRVRRDP
jgi:hypothetical protein